MRARGFAFVLGGVAGLACATPPQKPSPPAPDASISMAVASAPAPSSSPSPIARAPVASSIAPASASGSIVSPPEAPPGMALVPGGTFTMGSDDVGEMDERPAHRVTVAPFFLDLTEVTNEAYEECVVANVCKAHDPKSAHANKLGDDKAFRRPKQPISAIGWDDAKTYCAFRGKRLPTEAEWERAARGDDGRTYPWGNDPPTRDRAVFSAGVTEDVGTHPNGKGPYGHLDLAGNVWEWVADEYDPYAYRRATADRGIPGTCDEILAALAELKRNKMQGFTGTNPIPDECEHVLRGGAFNYPGKGLRSSNRVHHPGRFHLVMSGFRCAMDVSATPR